MSGRSIIFGAAASMLCAGGCLAALEFKPEGDLRACRWWILGSSTTVGLGVALSRGGSRAANPGRAERRWPLACALACAAITAAAWAASLPLVRKAASESPARAVRECESLIRAWPSRPRVSNFRELEWAIRASGEGVHRLDRRRRALGLVGARELRALDLAIRRDGLPGSGALGQPPRGEAPSGRAAQYKRMGDRVRAAARDLTTAADDSHVDHLMRLAGRIEYAVGLVGSRSGEKTANATLTSDRRQ